MSQFFYFLKILKISFIILQCNDFLLYGIQLNTNKITYFILKIILNIYYNFLHILLIYLFNILHIIISYNRSIIMWPNSLIRKESY